MLTAIIAIGLVVLSVAVFVNLLPLLANLFLYGVVAFFLLIKFVVRFVAKKILIALPWTIAAICAGAFGFIALGRQFFGLGNAKRFVEQFLPPREFERKTFALTLIEVMLILHEKILEFKNHAC